MDISIFNWSENYLVPERLEVPVSSGIPTKHTSSPSEVSWTGRRIIEGIPPERGIWFDVKGEFSFLVDGRAKETAVFWATLVKTERKLRDTRFIAAKRIVRPTRVHANFVFIENNVTSRSDDFARTLIGRARDSVYSCMCPRGGLWGWHTAKHCTQYRTLARERVRNIAVGSARLTVIGNIAFPMNNESVPFALESGSWWGQMRIGSDETTRASQHGPSEIGRALTTEYPAPKIYSLRIRIRGYAVELDHPSPRLFEVCGWVDARIRSGPRLWTIVAATLCLFFITFLVPMTSWVKVSIQIDILSHRCYRRPSNSYFRC